VTTSLPASRPADRAPQPAGLGWLDASLGAERLRDVRLFSDQPAEVLAWIAARTDVLRLRAGEALTQPSDTADWLFLTLEGELRARREALGAAAPVFVFRAGDVSGALPFSRMTHWPATSRAVVDATVARFPRSAFDALLRLAPALEPRFISLMADRVRDATARDQQFEKLTALGRLAAGLAHELNNPVAAAQRGAGEARLHLAGTVDATAALLDAGVSGGALRALVDRLGMAHASDGAPSTPTVPLDPIERADREDAMRALLDRAGLDDAWRAAPALVDAGVDAVPLADALRALPTAAHAPALAWLAAVCGARGALDVTAQSVRRVGALVHDVRTYTNLDHATDPEPIDVRLGVQSALGMARGALRARGLRVACDLGGGAPGEPFPRVHGVVVALNEVWSVLLQNAIDAAPAGRGTVSVRVRAEAGTFAAPVTRTAVDDAERTAAVDGLVTIEIGDDGPGIPDAIREQVWEPFFTTKDVGAGTGLGLAIARRVVLEHGGDITIESVPGDTRVRVRLPALVAAPPSTAH
jgi:signal transduction histidine kinase